MKQGEPLFALALGINVCFRCLQKFKFYKEGTCNGYLKPGYYMLIINEADADFDYSVRVIKGGFIAHVGGDVMDNDINSDMPLSITEVKALLENNHISNIEIMTANAFD